MISDAALPVTKDGRIYHLDLLPEELADTVITVGDPKRVEAVSQRFDRIDTKAMHREFVTHTGWIGSKRLSVISTGIGTPSIDIVMNELDALRNIDFSTRKVKEKHTALTVIRFGTTGSLSKSLDIGEMVISKMALGLDGLLNYYHYEMTDLEKQWLNAFNEKMGELPIPPYLVSADPVLAASASALGMAGVTITSPGFYGPQGRMLRAAPFDAEMINRLMGFTNQSLPILNLEMETAAIFGMGRLLGHRCISLATVVANRCLGTFCDSLSKPINNMIDKGLAWAANLPD